MESITTKISKVTDQIEELNGFYEFADKGTDLYKELTEKITVLEDRSYFLEKYKIILETRAKKINVDIDESREKSETKRQERLAQNEKTIMNIVDRLPDLADLNVENLRSSITKVPNNVIQVDLKSYAGNLTHQYVEKYLKQFNQVAVEKNFFYAAACSQYGIYVSTGYENLYSKLADELLFHAKLPPSTQYPLSLTDVDLIIHSLQPTDSNESGEVFIIFDTSLSVILTNLPKTLPSTCYKYVLIYDSESKLFAPLSQWTKDNYAMCPKCIRFELGHECERICPMCLREGKDFRCFKSSQKSEPFICPECNSFCQTSACYTEHLRVKHASRNEQNVSKIIHDNALHGLLLTSLYDVSLANLVLTIIALNNTPEFELTRIRKELQELHETPSSNIADDCDRALQEYDDLPPFVAELLSRTKAALSGKTPKY